MPNDIFMGVPVSIISEEWVDFMLVQKLSDKTISEYYRYFNHYVQKYSTVDLDTFNLWITKNNNNVSRSFLKKLIEFLSYKGYLKGDDLLKLIQYKPPRVTGRAKKKSIEVLTREEVEALASASDNRTKVMVLATFYLGLRKQELLGLRFKDINWVKSTVKIRLENAKGNKERVIPAPARLMNELTTFVMRFGSEVSQKAYEENKLIFNRSESWWEQHLNRYALRVFSRKINPHLLRHSYGTYLKSKGLDLQEIAELMGHSRIETTRIYAHLDNDKLKEQVKEVFK